MEINEALGYLLNAGSRLIKRRMDACLVEFDLTSTQWSVLKLLQEKKMLTQARISHLQSKAIIHKSHFIDYCWNLYYN